MWTPMDRVKQIIDEFPQGNGAYLTVVAFDAAGHEQKIGRVDLGSPAEAFAWVKGVLDSEGRKPGIEKCRVRLWGPGGSSGPSVMCRWEDSTDPMPVIKASLPKPEPARPLSSPPSRHREKGATHPSAGGCQHRRRLEAELRDARLDIRSLKNGHESDAAVVNEEMDKNRELRRKYAPIQEQLRRADQERDALSVKNQRLRDRIVDLKHETAGLTAELQAAQQQNVQWARGVSQINAMIDDEQDDAWDEEDE